MDRNVSIRQLARDAGMPFTTVYKRLSRGQSLEEALTPHKPKLYSYRGKTMTATEWAREIGMDPSTMCNRLKKMSIGQAIRRSYRKKFIHNLTGQRFGRLLAGERLVKKGDSYFVCQCDCGNVVEVKGYHLVRGQQACSRSAECRSYSTKRNTPRYRPHLLAKEAGVGVEYTIWLNRRRRGLLPEEWLSFWYFIECVGPRPNINWQLRKEDPNGPYDSTNVGWIKIK